MERSEVLDVRAQREVLLRAPQAAASVMSRSLLILRLEGPPPPMYRRPQPAIEAILRPQPYLLLLGHPAR